MLITLLKHWQGKVLCPTPLYPGVSINKRKEMVLKACREYSIDGAIMHSNKSCVPISLGQMDIIENTG